MPDFLQPLIEGAVSSSLVAALALVGYWGLIALVSCVAVFDKGRRGKNAREVLKLLLRRRPPRRNSIDKSPSSSPHL